MKAEFIPRAKKIEPKEELKETKLIEAPLTESDKILTFSNQDKFGKFDEKI